MVDVDFFLDIHRETYARYFNFFCKYLISMKGPHFSGSFFFGCEDWLSLLLFFSFSFQNVFWGFEMWGVDDDVFVHCCTVSRYE